MDPHPTQTPPPDRARAPDRPRAPTGHFRPPAPRAPRAPPSAPSTPHDANPPSAPSPASAVTHSPPDPPLLWSDCFASQTDLPVPSRNATFRLYHTPPPAHTSPAPPLLVLLHGAGHTALSWALFSRALRPRVAVLAFDAREHGGTRPAAERDEPGEPDDLSVEALVADVAALVAEFLATLWHGPSPRVVLVGHSMGGAIATRAATVVGAAALVVLDVVEGTAVPALRHMRAWVRGRPRVFVSTEAAVRYVTGRRELRNVASARISVPAQLVPCEGGWGWRTDLAATEPFWRGWFVGLSALFVGVAMPKMLVLAGVDRLDRELMIAQMQGKFQNIVIPAAGHAVHEDQPDATARVLLDFLERNMLLEGDGDDAEAAVFQQRSPIPPCC